jgi:hypothetical protein
LNLLKTWPPPIFPSLKSYPVSITNLKNAIVALKNGTGDNEAIPFLTLFIFSSTLAFDSYIVRKDFSHQLYAYLYLYVYTCVHIHTYVYMYTCIYIYANKYIHVHIKTIYAYL